MRPQHPPKPDIYLPIPKNPPKPDIHQPMPKYPKKPDIYQPMPNPPIPSQPIAVDNSESVDKFRTILLHLDTTELNIMISDMIGESKRRIGDFMPEH